MFAEEEKMRVAVIGAGISGLAAAHVLLKAGGADIDVVLYEEERRLGGGAARIVTTIDGVDLDLAFMSFNHAIDSQVMDFMEGLEVNMKASDSSFSVSLPGGRGVRREWGTRSGLSGLFTRKRNAVDSYYWMVVREIIKFKDDVIRYFNEYENCFEVNLNETLGQFITSHGYSLSFQKAYLIPICASIWSCCFREGIMDFSAYYVLSFFRDHHLFQLFPWQKCHPVRWSSLHYVSKIQEELEKSRHCQIRTCCRVQSVASIDGVCRVTDSQGLQEDYDRCIVSVNAPDALKLLGEQATYEELRVLGAYQYVYSDTYLHRDRNFMPENPVAWSARNILGTTDNSMCLTYWLDALQVQNTENTSLPFLVTLNPPHAPQQNLLKWTTIHLIPSTAAAKASLDLDEIQGKRGIWFSGSYQGYGFCEDGLKAGIVAAHGLIGQNHANLSKSLAVFSFLESGTRLIVTRFLQHYISIGSLILLDGGSIFRFEGAKRKTSPKCILKVNNPQFYWKVATQADLGFADAYINGDISFIDKNEGLLNFFMIFIANRDAMLNNNRHESSKGWWTPLLSTAVVGSAKYFFQHILRHNSPTQARRNISRHYDLSNDMFSLFMDETMMYSAAIFKSENEPLSVAQQRKISLLIEKARIDSKHEVLEIGCGWGALAIEVVKQTGCKYTGITLSEEPLKFAEMKVKEAGLQDRITFILCDYRQLPTPKKYNRIISCEMIEAVGHEYMEEFFRSCEALLAEDGLLVLQFSSIPDERYDQYRRSSDFIKEYIFPGACLPCVSRVTSAMANASRLCVEHLENIGIHLYQTFECWRKQFMENQSKIQELGFDEKFIRTWEYYFVYCAAGYKSRTLENYQIVFSRPGNYDAFSDPYKSFPAA
ncbi:hypothetical protein QJS10_CPA08g01585 [Acorus calamus]|uniref:Amine oxidase domain-containing protein n=1 Tax=Acorus calamus TaxID=4465 RepID=A0AAV9EDD0_ACOCL|nr:hypothetical protein QJS10_CPA08g01585 [Acorus calamus]